MTILNSEPILTIFDIIGILLMILFLSALLSLVILSDTMNKWMFIIVTIIMFIIASLIIIPIEYPRTKLKRLEVLIEKDYPFEDIYEKYNIKNKRGKIWTLEEKEVNNSG